MGCIFSKEEAEHYGFQGTLLAPWDEFRRKVTTSTIVVIKLLSGKELLHLLV